jgi:hypothetical protein
MQLPDRVEAVTDRSKSPIEKWSCEVQRLSRHRSQDEKAVEVNLMFRCLQLTMTYPSLTGLGSQALVELLAGLPSEEPLVQSLALALPSSWASLSSRFSLPSSSRLSLLYLS